MGSRHITLHAGLPKTGTSTIQNAFWACRDALRTQAGVLYPGLAPHHTNAICTMFLDDPSTHITNKMAALRGPVDLPALQARYRRDLEAELSRDDWQHAVISAEGISNLAATEIAKFRDWASGFADTISVLYWVREPVAYVTSIAQQLFTGGWTMDRINEAPPLPNFKRKISNAIAVFGKEAVRVEAFEAAVRAEGGPAGAFCDQVGLPPDMRAEVVEIARHDNEALSHEAAMMLSHLNKTRPLFGTDGPPHRTGREVQQLRRVKGNKFLLPMTLRGRIHNQTRPDVNWLNETFGLDLFRAPFDEVETPGQPTRPETLQSMSVLLSELMNVNEGLVLALRTAMGAVGSEDPAVVSDMARARHLSRNLSEISQLSDRLGLQS